MPATDDSSQVRFVDPDQFANEVVLAVRARLGRPAAAPETEEEQGRERDLRWSAYEVGYHARGGSAAAGIPADIVFVCRALFDSTSPDIKGEAAADLLEIPTDTFFGRVVAAARARGKVQRGISVSVEELALLAGETPESVTETLRRGELDVGAAGVEVNGALQRFLQGQGVEWKIPAWHLAWGDGGYPPGLVAIGPPSN